MRLGSAWGQGKPLMITIESLNSALGDLRRSTREKGPPASSMLRVVVAFAEGITPRSIVKQVRDGEFATPRGLANLQLSLWPAQPKK